jgi:hypothetical protein
MARRKPESLLETIQRLGAEAAEQAAAAEARDEIDPWDLLVLDETEFATAWRRWMAADPVSEAPKPPPRARRR